MFDIETIYSVIMLGFLAMLSIIIKKRLLTFVTPKQLIYLDCFFRITPIMLFLILSGNILPLLAKIKKMDGSEIGLLFLYSIIATIGGFGTLWLVKHKNISKAMPLVAAISTLFIFIAGVFLYKEKVTFPKCIAIVAICLGIYLMNA